MVVCPKNNFGSDHGIGFRHGLTNPRKEISLGVTVLELVQLQQLKFRECVVESCAEGFGVQCGWNCWS